MSNRSRRRLLASLGGLSSAALAGCFFADDSTTTEQPGDQETATEPDPVDLAIDTELVYDLQDLEYQEPAEYTPDEVREQYSHNLLNAIEDHDALTAANLDAEQLSLETIDGEAVSQDETPELAEFDVTDGEELRAVYTTEQDDQVTVTYQITKRLPHEIRLDAHVNGQKEPWLQHQQELLQSTDQAVPERQPTTQKQDGEYQLQEYSTPFNFDNYNFQPEQFFQKRNQFIAEDRMDISGQTEGIEEEAEREIDFDEAENKQEKIEKASQFVDFYENFGASEAAQIKANAMEHILRNQTDLENVHAGGFNNPSIDGRPGGNHGSQLIYADGDVYHSETLGSRLDAAVHVDNIEEIEMNRLDRENSLADFNSVIYEMEPGFPKNNYYEGHRRLTGMIDQFAISASMTGFRPFSAEHDLMFGMRERILDNMYTEAIMSSMMANDHHLESDKERFVTVFEAEDGVHLGSRSDNELNEDMNHFRSAEHTDPNEWFGVS